jgi:hypothetical protein
MTPFSWHGFGCPWQVPDRVRMNSVQAAAAGFWGLFGRLWEFGLYKVETNIERKNSHA